jgi:hypothetical protein
MTQQQFEQNRVHNISIHLLNSEGYFISLSKEYITDLQVEDNFLRWWVTGYIDIKNEYDFLEKGLQATGKVDDPSQVSQEQLAIKKDTNSTYVFRNDGEDYIAISIEVPQAENDFHHSMMYIVNVYDTEDINTNVQTDKIKRLYFRDEKYHRLKHMNLCWSTADKFNTVGSTHIRHLSDVDRQLPTGDAIKHLLTIALGDDTRFAGGWDPGSTSMLYTSSVNSKCIDDLNYLLDHHVSSSTSGLSTCVLMFDRGYKMWRIVSLLDVFAHAANWDEKTGKYFAGDLQQERFQLVAEATGDLSEEKTTPSTYRVPRGGDGVYTNVNFEDSSTIKSIKFKEMTSTDNLEALVTTPVHIHDNVAKRFYINQSEHNLASVYKKITGLLSYMVREKGSTTSTSIDVRKTRANNKNMNHVYDTSDVSSDKVLLSKSLNKNVLKGIMLSNSVEFIVPGEPLRQSGRFISIDPHSDSTDSTNSAYHNKIYGQYLILSCTHRLQSGKYTNKLVGIKPYNYKSIHKDPKLNEPETYETFEKSLTTEA